MSNMSTIRDKMPVYEPTLSCSASEFIDIDGMEEQKPQTNNKVSAHEMR